MQEFINRRTQTILKGLDKHGHYTLPNGSIIVRVESMGSVNGKGLPGPCVRMLTDENDDTIRTVDGSCVRFRLDPHTGQYVRFAG